MTSNAIVPFSYASPFHATHLDPTRTFHFGDHAIVIQQQWKPDGRGGTNLGFGAHVYEAAILLSLTLPELVQNKRVVELGCGTGLVSLAAAAFGASTVVATDGDPQSVALTQSNITNNSMGNIDAKVHLWGQELDAIEACDVLLGADIIACPYEQAFDDLLSSLRHFVAAPSAIALITYKPRHESEVKFFHKLKRHFVYEIIATDTTFPDFAPLGIQLLRIQRKPAA
ncbi:hypothetical protein SDRG_03507 [Saprolegnia diclina VS20]|uniref:Methyltransferase small domain-containing protein n=1 Tax=Saprolegnia diclina (strain VS20) TaxID=1156394 RepID=T0S9C5_SAPDV|nr:hypothetical protein SDRG_03507 [Saprolegnia diclina VS20]EQC39302.1 hypothetical protein SDRG_03507 [Saprolegnia diclina VS20]|eukprot:XP_008607363.1 hypothetical protein SDRG_03507 [Saprolegnia diclina VS20]